MHYAVFNQKVSEFMSDLILAYPEIEHFKKLKGIFTLVKNVAEDKPAKLFKSYIADRYKEHITQKNEQFFLGFEDYHDDIKCVTEHPEYWNEFIQHLKVMWTTMHDDNKNAIWNYMILLTLLCENVS